MAEKRAQVPQTIELRPRALSLATDSRPRGNRNDPADPAVNDGALASIRFGVLVLLLFFGLSGYWLYRAPLDSAAQAPGVVKVEGNRKTIQHLDGGIVREILVREGDLVKRDQVLIRLDSVQVQSAVDIYTSQLDSLKAQEARLKAERDGLPVIEFPPELLARAGVGTAADAIRGESQLFLARRVAQEAQFSVLRQQVLQAGEQTRGAQAQAQALERQNQLISEELAGTRELYERGYAPKTRVLALERAMASIAGQMAEYRGTVGRLRYAMTQAEAQIEQARRDRLSQVAAELNATQARLIDVSERLTAAQDSLNRVEIRAPETGYVVGLTTFTVGGVIARGEKVMEIVPENSAMLIEARLKPEDAKDVHEGMRTELHLLAYKAKGVPIIHGTIRTRSADRFTDPRTGEGYFMIEVIADQAELATLDGVRLAPGMPVEVLVPLGARTALEYLVEPLLDAARKSFRER